MKEKAKHLQIVGYVIMAISIAYSLMLFLFGMNMSLKMRILEHHELIYDFPEPCKACGKMYFQHLIDDMEAVQRFFPYALAVNFLFVLFVIYFQVIIKRLVKQLPNK